SCLPAELDGIVTACLARSPAQRPTSAALLGQLGPFVAGPAGPRSADAYLPAPAIAMISGYQHGPRLAAPARGPAAGDGGEDTSGSTGDGAAGEDTSGSTGGSMASDATIGSHAALPAPAAALRPLSRGARRL